MRSQMIHRKRKCSLQVLVYSGFIFIGKRNHFIDKCQISGLRNIFIYRWKQPQSIIRTICRMPGFLYIGSIIRRILMSGIVCKFDKRKSSSVIHLCRKHKPDLFECHLRCKMNHTLNILHGIAVSVTVSQTTVEKRRRT